jgi:myo-inositol-1(or 4)-monophosphatase
MAYHMGRQEVGLYVIIQAMDNNQLATYLNFITETAYLAGRLTLGYYQTDVRADYKSDDTPVTIADRAAEELIRNRIAERFPDHAIVGEEFGLKETSEADYRWFIDPIDGTKAFLRGVPLYAVLIGLEIQGRVEAGAAYFPALDEMIAAGSGLGCWWNGRRARVSNISQLSRGIVTSTSAQFFGKYGRQAEWERFMDRCYFQAGWGDAYGYLLVATGRAEVMLDPIMNVWDCGPFPPILREAGGYFGDWNGKETIYAGESMATTQQLLPEVLALIRGED